MSITQKVIFIWLFLGIPLLSFFVLRKSFNLGLYGDDWQHLYNLWREFFVYKTKSFLDIRSYLNPYWPNYFYLGIINHFWGFYPPAYFIASFLMRLFANISLFFLTYELTKSKLAAILATIIFLFSAAGLQTTDWVFNMNTYTGLGFLSIASVFYLKIRRLETIRSWYYPLFILTFTLALAIVPTRMHGAIPFLILTDLFLTFISEGKNLLILGGTKSKINRYLILRIFIAISVFATLLFFKSFGEGSFTTNRLSENTQVIQAFIQKGYHSIWFFFFGILGHLALPDRIGLNNFIAVVAVTGIISTILGLIISLFIFKVRQPSAYLPVIVFNIIWSLILSWLISINPNPVYYLNPYPPSHVLFSIAVGGQFIFYTFWLSILTRKNYPHFSATFIISIIWIITLSIIYWLFTPYYIIETTGRYMTMGAAGFAIFFGSFSSLLFLKITTYQKGGKTRVLASFSLLIPTIIFLFWIIVNFQHSQSYLGILEQTRNRELTDRTWNTLVKTVPKLDPEGPSIFFFTTDNPLSLQGVLVFGFFMRAGMTYRIPNQDLTPLPSTDYTELLAYATDGSPLQKIHGRKAAPVPLSRIYAFDFRNGQLMNITEIVHKKIVEDLGKNTTK